MELFDTSKAVLILHSLLLKLFNISCPSLKIIIRREPSPQIIIDVSLHYSQTDSPIICLKAKQMFMDKCNLNPKIIEQGEALVFSGQDAESLAIFFQREIKQLEEEDRRNAAIAADFLALDSHQGCNADNLTDRRMLFACHTLIPYARANPAIREHLMNVLFQLAQTAASSNVEMLGEVWALFRDFADSIFDDRTREGKQARLKVIEAFVTMGASGNAILTLATREYGDFLMKLSFPFLDDQPVRPEDASLHEGYFVFLMHFICDAAEKRWALFEADQMVALFLHIGQLINKLPLASNLAIQNFFAAISSVISSKQADIRGKFFTFQMESVVRDLARKISPQVAGNNSAIVNLAFTLFQLTSPNELAKYPIPSLTNMMKLLALLAQRVEGNSLAGNKARHNLAGVVLNMAQGDNDISRRLFLTSDGRKIVECLTGSVESNPGESTGGAYYAIAKLLSVVSSISGIPDFFATREICNALVAFGDTIQRGEIAINKAVIYLAMAVSNFARQSKRIQALFLERGILNMFMSIGGKIDDGKRQANNARMHIAIALRRLSFGSDASLKEYFGVRELLDMLLQFAQAIQSDQQLASEVCLQIVITLANITSCTSPHVAQVFKGQPLLELLRALSRSIQPGRWANPITLHIAFVISNLTRYSDQARNDFCSPGWLELFELLAKVDPLTQETNKVVAWIASAFSNISCSKDARTFYMSQPVIEMLLNLAKAINETAPGVNDAVRWLTTALANMMFDREETQLATEEVLRTIFSLGRLIVPGSDGCNEARQWLASAMCNITGAYRAQQLDLLHVVPEITALLYTMLEGVVGDKTPQARAASYFIIQAMRNVCTRYSQFIDFLRDKGIESLLKQMEAELESTLATDRSAQVAAASMLFSPASQKNTFADEAVLLRVVAELCSIIARPNAIAAAP